jgi:hypothetical protein
LVLKGTAILAVIVLSLLLLSTFSLSFIPASSGSGLAASKISSSLKLDGRNPQRIIVVAKGGLDGIAKDMHLTFKIGSPNAYLAFGTVRHTELMNLASLPGVVKILPDIPINYNDSRLDSSAGLIQTDMFKVRSILGADKVNSILKINGTGVKVAIVDTGTDFGNTELSGAIARDGHGTPIQLDPDGSGLVLTNNTVGKVVNSTGVYLDLVKNGRGTPVSVYVGAPAFPFPVVQTVNWTLANFKIGSNSSQYIVSKSGVYHFGLIFEVTTAGIGLFPVLVVDSTVAGAYDTVYTDMRSAPFIGRRLSFGAIDFKVAPDFSFLNEKAHHLGDGTEALAADFTGDGIPDISAGMLGARVLDVFGAVSSGKSGFNIDLGATNGSLLAPIDPKGNYFGVMYDFEGHGTQTAANAAARGVNSYDLYGNGTKYRLQGVAPGSQVIAVKALFIGDVFYGLMWASGFDYHAATGNWVYSGQHKADIVSNSWGYSVWPVFISGSGYDVLSILEDALSVPGSFNSSYAGTLMVHAAGNGGPGYGTITPPGSSSFSLSVGASTTWHIASHISKDPKGAYYGGPSGYFDDIISWSARGPSPTGEPKPDLVAPGAFAFVPTATMSAKGDGSAACSTFGGTSESTPLTAGVAALVEQALKKTGTQFDPFGVKDILMSTAQDVGNDAFAQGAGRVNALAAVSYALHGSSIEPGVFKVSTNSTFTTIINSLGGAEDLLSNVLNQKVSMPSSSHAEESWFAGSVGQRQSASSLFSIENPTAKTLKITLNTTSFQVVGEKEFSNVSIPGKSRFINLTQAIGPIPKGIDMVVFRQTMPFTAWYNSTISPLYLHAVTRLRLQVYDWNNVVHDRIPKLNEVALINTNYAWGNAEEVRIAKPSAKFTHTALIGVYQNPDIRSYWIGETTKKAKPVHFTIHVFLLKKVSWNWVSLDKTSLLLAARSTASFTADLSVPANTSPGVYEGFVTLAGNNSQLTDIPVSVVVPISPSQKGIPSVFGGASEAKGILYDNGAVFGANDLAWRYESGNWRTFKVNINDSTINQGTARINWTSPYTSINLFVLDPQGRIIATSVPPGLYKSLGRTPLPILAAPSNDYLGYSFFNNLTWGGGFAPSQNNGKSSSIVEFPVNETGAYTIIIQNTLYGGETSSETFTGEVELNTVLPILLSPLVSVTSPTSPTSGVVTIPVNVTGQGLSSGSYSVDSSPPAPLPMFSNRNGARSVISNIVVDTTKLTDGPHLITIQVSDAVGHVTTKTMTIFALNSPPNVFIGNPPDGGRVNGTVSITFSVSGPFVNKATLAVDNSTVEVTSKSSYRWDSSAVRDGTHLVKLTAQNAAGLSATKSVSFTTNNQALAQAQAQQKQQVAQLTTELEVAMIALIILIASLALVVVRRRPRVTSGSVS